MWVKKQQQRSSLFKSLAYEFNAHFFIDINLLQGFTKLLESDILIIAYFVNSSFSDRVQLLIGQIGSHKHIQNLQQLALIYFVILVAVIDAKQKLELGFFWTHRIAFVASKLGKYTHKLLEIDLLIATYPFQLTEKRAYEIIRFYGVTVSTQDSESCDPSSNLGRTWLFKCHMFWK